MRDGIGFAAVGAHSQRTDHAPRGYVNEHGVQFGFGDEVGGQRAGPRGAQKQRSLAGAFQLQILGAALTQVFLVSTDAQVDDMSVGSESRDNDAARDKDFTALPAIVTNAGCQSQGGTGAVASGISGTLGRQIADMIGANCLLGDAARGQPVQRGRLFFDECFRFCEQLGGVGAPLLGWFRPFARSPYLRGGAVQPGRGDADTRHGRLRYPTLPARP